MYITSCWYIFSTCSKREKLSTHPLSTRTTALLLFSPSSCIVSRADSVSSIEKRKDDLTEERGIDTPVCNLEEIASCLGVDHANITAECEAKKQKTVQVISLLPSAFRLLSKPSQI